VLDVQRVLDDSGTAKYGVRLSAYGANCDIRARVVPTDMDVSAGSPSTTTLDVSTASSTLVLFSASVLEAPSAALPFKVYLQGFKTQSGSGTGRLAHFAVREIVAVSGYIPTS